MMIQTPSFVSLVSQKCFALLSCATQNNFRRYTLSFILFALGLLVFPLTLSAQDSRRNTEYKADQTKRSNARINPTTLGMEFSLPLTSYKGRAGNSLPVTFNYSSKVWRISAAPYNWRRVQGTVVTMTNPVYAEKSAAGWTTSLSPPSIDTKTDLYVDDFSQQPNWEGRPWAENLDPDNDTDISDKPTYNDPVYNLFYIKRVRVEMPDGSAVEFRKDDAKHPYGNTKSPERRERLTCWGHS